MNVPALGPLLLMLVLLKLFAVVVDDAAGLAASVLSARMLLP